MSEVSDRTLLLLQELALLKESDSENRISAAERTKRQKEIRAELKRLAAQKDQETR